MLSERGQHTRLNGWKGLGRLHLNNWPRIIEDYTSRFLTVDTDRLPALSGLAHEYRNQTKERYLAGLWEEQLWRHLLWYARVSVESRPKVYLAPTWSWASIVAEVGFIGTRYSTQQVEILKADTQPAGNDPFGKVSGGSLTLRGLLRIFQLQKRVGARRNSWESLSRVEPVEEAEPGYVLSDDKTYWPANLDMTGAHEEKNVMFLYISERDGVILEMTENHEEYRRIGMASVSDIPAGYLPSTLTIV